MFVLGRPLCRALALWSPDNPDNVVICVQPFFGAIYVHSSIIAVSSVA
jgi:hypothetical protein